MTLPQLFVGEVIAEGGEFSALEGEAWSRPEDPWLAREVGSIKMFMTNALEVKMEKLQAFAFPALDRFDLSPELKDDIKDRFDSLCSINLVLHELGHTYLKPCSAATALGSYYNLLEEPRAEINSLYFALKLEDEGVLPKGTSIALFVSDISLFSYKAERYHSTGLRGEYLISTTMWILKGIKYGLRDVGGESWSFRNDKTRLELLVNELFTFFKTIVRFGSDKNPEIASYQATMQEETEKLLTSYAS